MSPIETILTVEPDGSAHIEASTFLGRVGWDNG
jgi:hypothetical protein